MCNLYGIAIFAVLLSVGTKSHGETSKAFLPPDIADHGWPSIRGPSFDGCSPEINLANEWPASGPPILWSRSLGQGYSAIVVSGDRAYTQAQSLGGQYVHCLDANTGETIWEYRYDWPYEPAGLYPGPRATPTIHGDSVYFVSPSGELGCLNALTGKLKWLVNLVETYHGEGQGFGYACSPTIIDDLVFMLVGGKNASMVALSAKDGSEVWRSGSDAASYTPALPIRYQGRGIVVGYMQNCVVAHERSTGKLVFRTELSNGYDEHSAWPLYREPYLWLSGPFRGGSTLYEITSTGMKPVWSNNKLSNDVASSVLVGDHIYGFDVLEAQSKAHRPTRGVFRCLEFATGKVCWTQGEEKERPKFGKDVGHAAVIAADGKLYLLNDMGELIMARATPESYEELGRIAIFSGDPVWTTPTLSRGRIYARNHATAMCIYVGRPEDLETKALNAAVTLSASTDHGRRDWAELLLPIEPEFAFDVPSRRWFISWYLTGATMLLLCVALTPFFAKGKYTLGTIMLSLIFAACGGAVGTTFLSRWENDFVFTWPLTLFAVFYAALLDLPLSRNKLTAHQRRRSWFAVAMVLFTCALYYWLCRRLSLVTEWAFLGGLGSAAPFAIVHRLLMVKDWNWSRQLGVSLVITAAGFAAFFWSSVLLLWWKTGGFSAGS